MEIKFENVSYEIKKINFKPIKVLENINIEFEENKINSIIGESGSGKTTIMNLLYRLLNPTTGKIKINSEKVGYSYQNPNDQLLGLSVYEELEEICSLNNYTKEKAEKKIIDVLLMIGFSKDYLFRNSTELSQSEKRKLSIAMALLSNPKIILLDEPTLGLDNEGKKQMLQLIRKINKRYNKTIIIASNDIEFIHKITDYIYVLYDKKIVLKDTKYEVFKQDLEKYKIEIPNVMKFSNMALKKKKIRLGYRDDINDLIKDIYRKK